MSSLEAINEHDTRARTERKTDVFTTLNGSEYSVFFQNVPNVFRNAPNGLGMGKKLDFIGVGC